MDYCAAHPYKIYHYMINSILRAFGFYDLNGLKYRTSYLASLRPIVPFMAKTEQVKFVDKKTRYMVNHLSHLHNVMAIDPETVHLKDWNTTSVGNLAYTAVYCRDEKARRHAILILEKLRKNTTPPPPENAIII